MNDTKPTGPAEPKITGNSGRTYHGEAADAYAAGMAAGRERIAELADERGATVIEPGGPFGAGVIRPFADLIRENRP